MEERSRLVREQAKRDYAKGMKMLKKMSAFGEGDDIAAGKKRLEMEMESTMMISRALQKSSKYFVNLNWVETVFTVSAIFICLSGIMFSSGYFKNPMYAAQSDVLSVATLLVVVVTIAYFFFVVGKEIRGHKLYRETKSKAKWSSFKKKVNFHTDLLKKSAANATAKEKDSVVKLESAFRGKKARDELRERIMKEGTDEQKAMLINLERKRAERKEKALAEKKKMKKLKREKSRKKKRSQIGMRTRKATVPPAASASSSSGTRLASWGSKSKK